MILGRARARLGWTAAALLLVALVHPAPALSQSGPDSVSIPEPVGHVNDFAGLMDDDSRAKLEAFLVQVKEKTHADFAVLTVKSTAPMEPSEYKVRVFERWKLGTREENLGLLMLVAVDQTEVRFENSYGLEGTLPDGFQSRVYRAIIRPHFLDKDFAGGITEGMKACAARLAQEKGVTLEWDGRELRYTEPPRGKSLSQEKIIILFVVLFIVLSTLARMQGYRRRRLGGWWWLGPGGFGGIGGFGGGGFGGGGGGGFGGFGGGGSSGGGGGGGGGSGGW